VKLPLRLSEGVPIPPVTVRGNVPEKLTVSPAVVNGSRAAGNSTTTPRPVSGPLRRFTPLGFELAL